MNEPLYLIAERYLSLLDIEGEIDAQTFSDTLESIQGELDDKIGACALFVRNLQAEENMVGDEMDRLKERKDALHFRRERLRQYMMVYMQRTNVQKVKTPLVSVSVSKGREKVIVDSLALIPDEFVKIERKPMLKEIAAQLESGNPLAGCHVERGDPFLSIR